MSNVNITDIFEKKIKRKTTAKMTITLTEFNEKKTYQNLNTTFA